ncbi:MAG: hypothetical protein JXN59_02700 [Anaerolineae bacterium]|nr:hypothetical protein [Anaerolineae bacterium]
MKSRILSVLLVVMLVLMAAPAVLAQGIDDMTCAGLSESDCAILLQATANSADVESFYADFAADLLLSNLGAVAMMFGEAEEVGDITFTLAGDGVFMTDEAGNPPIRLEMAMNAEMNDGTETDGGSMNVIIADGIIYNSEDGGATWEGVTFEDALNSMDPESRAMIEGLFGGDLSELPEAALSPDDLAEGNPLAMLEEFGLSEDDIIALASVPGFFTQQRVEDEELLGQNMVVFETVIDLAPLFASQEFGNVLNGVMAAAAEEDPEAAEMGMMVPMLLSGLDVQIVQQQYIGADDMLVHGMAVDMALAFDLAILMGGAQEGQEMPPITMNMSFYVILDQINEMFDIVAPEGATMVDAVSMQ